LQRIATQLKIAKHTVTSELMFPEHGQCFITEHIVPDVFRCLRSSVGISEEEYRRSLTSARAC
jgi:hypothetical protein